MSNSHIFYLFSSIFCRNPLSLHADLIYLFVTQFQNCNLVGFWHCSSSFLFVKVDEMGNNMKNSQFVVCGMNSDERFIIWFDTLTWKKEGLTNFGKLVDKVKSFHGWFMKKFILFLGPILIIAFDFFYLFLWVDCLQFCAISFP